MNKFVISIVAIVIIIGGYAYFRHNKASNYSADSTITNTAPVSSTDSTAPATAVNANVKEFNMRSWMDTTNGKMTPHFSLAEIRVKKGDTVKINITNTAGTHDFRLDEFGIVQATPVNQTVTVQFVADKVGTFEYYCGMYNHRALGQRGNLIVE